MRTKTLCIILALSFDCIALWAQTNPATSSKQAYEPLLDRLPTLEMLARRSRPASALRPSASTCNNNGVCEQWLGESCTTCADCIGNAQCAELAQDCNRFNFVGGKTGPVYNQCLNDTYNYLMYLLEYLSDKYAAPGSNIVNDPSPLTPGDGRCNQYVISGTCGGLPTENCFNDPQDCGPCPTIQNISDPNIDAGTCDQTQCAQGVCTAGQCSNPSACQFNCGSAHYGGTYPGQTVESDAVDFAVDTTNCSTIATLANNICLSGFNFVSYAPETPGTLHVSANSLKGSFPAVPDSTGVPPIACPSTTGGPPSFRAWLAASAINNTLFTVGGGICNTCSGFGGNEVPTTETYDTTSTAWYTKGTLRTARFGLAASTANGKIYALGGTSGTQSAPVQTVEEYDPGTDLWSAKTTMPTPRWKLTASTVNGIIYTIGGGTSGNQCTPTGIVEAYDPVANTWATTTKKPMPTARWGAASDVLNGQIYIVGGSQSCPQGSVIVSYALEVYDPSTDGWVAKMPMPTARWDLAAAAVNGKLYAIGGWDPVNQTALDVVEEFDPSTNLWATKSPMPTKRSGLTAVTINGKIYAFGGVNEFNRLLTSLETYDPTIDKWTTAPSAPPINPPSITFVSPSSGNQGQTISNFTVVGSNFGSQVSLSFSNQQIVVNSLTTTPTQIVANVTIGATVPSGTYDVIVTNPDGQTGTLPSGFTVLAGAAPPTIKSVWLISGIPGETITNFTVNGNNFFPGAALTFGGRGIKIISQTVVSATVITAYISLASTASLGARDVIVTNPDLQKGMLPGGFSIVASTGFLAFPLLNKTAFTAAINTVFDHSMSFQYCPDSQGPQLVTAYTGEQGSSQFIDKSPGATFTCQLPPKKKNVLYGYKKDSLNTHFLINGDYVGAGQKQFLFYNGHPGFDYRTTDQNIDGTLCPNKTICNPSGKTPVLAAAAGTVVCVAKKGAPCPEGPGEIKIDHGNGYFSIYLHLSTISVDIGPVTNGQQIGVSGGVGTCSPTPCTPAPHLHFEVRKTITSGKPPVPIDPYGWTGQGTDPYAPRATNVNLWK